MASTREHENPLPDIVCLSHLRWGSVYQRPQHLMSRFGRHRRVVFCEEPMFGETSNPRLELTSVAEGVFVARPKLPGGLEPETVAIARRLLLHSLLREMELEDYVLWYYTPLALGFTADLAPAAVVYDCMDGLSGGGSGAALPERERQLLAGADLVFTAGRSLYEAKRPLHPSVHDFPSSVDVAHFAKARRLEADDEPADQATLPRPRLGFLGVIDERLNADLVDGVARRRPDWQIVLAGPVLKIDPTRLPRRPNIHYLGAKTYESLPSYLAGWDVALLPFALNHATRFVSPTKTAEYLAAGLPVVSTPLADVVRPYGEVGVVRIASGPEGFVREIESALVRDRADGGRARAVDAVLRGMSWDRTWSAMDALVERAVAKRVAVGRRASGARPRSTPPLATEVRP